MGGMGRQGRFSTETSMSDPYSDPRSARNSFGGFGQQEKIQSQREKTLRLANQGHGTRGTTGKGRLSIDASTLTAKSRLLTPPRDRPNGKNGTAERTKRVLIMSPNGSTSDLDLTSGTDLLSKELGEASAMDDDLVASALPTSPAAAADVAEIERMDRRLSGRVLPS